MPDTFKFVLSGGFAPGVYSQGSDAAPDRQPGRGWLRLQIGRVLRRRACRLSVSERMTMTNLAMEMGVKCAFVPPDAKTAEYLRRAPEGSDSISPVLRRRGRRL